MYLHQKINYQTPRASADFSSWIEEHSRLVNKISSEYQDEGGTVTVEDENSFKFNSKTGICLSGKCDVVVGQDRSGHEVGLVIDVKTGARKPKDRTQVMLYMALLPSIKDIPHISRTPIGIVQYKDGTTHEIDPEEITPEFKEQVGNL
ncbi:PD-(D/E)XK nuclease family protein [Synechococcus sp. MIT S1220]|uniref:PD-(D/E)XK nuclease family protein n=1 Tax=Synechococcus sp. MIT S1220 TaxID=3082549 RepID=UPI0039AF1E3E